jgi:putative acetyltransferase
MPGGRHDYPSRRLRERAGAGAVAFAPCGCAREFATRKCQSFDLPRLKAPDISVYTAWRDDKLLGMAALKQLDDATGEIKSMRTDPAHLRERIAKALLDHILGVARARGYRRLSLETGSGEAFEPALALYRKNGFVNGEAFGGYEATPFNQLLHLDLTPAA